MRFLKFLSFFSTKIKRRKKLIDPEYLHQIGGMCFGIKQITETINITVASQFSFKGNNATTQINSKTDNSLKSIVEKRIETLYDDHKKRVRFCKILKVLLNENKSKRKFRKKYFKHIKMVKILPAFGQI